MNRNYMLIIIISAVVLAGAGITFALKSTGKEMPSFKVTVDLKVEVVGEQVKAILTFTNPEAYGPAQIEKRLLFPGGELSSNVFKISTREGKEIKYKGIMAKLKEPGPEDFIKIKPKQSVKATVNLENVYDFPTGADVYEIKYETYSAGGPSIAALIRLESNKDYFTFYKGYSFAKAEYGKSVKTPEGIIVEFLDVVNDSRCPVDWECLVSGNASIKVNAYHDGSPKPDSPQTLNIEGGYIGGKPTADYKIPGKGNVLEIGNWSLVFARLEPYPVSRGEIKKFSYFAHFFVIPFK